MKLRRVPRMVAGWLSEQRAEYSAGDHRPIAGYSLVLTSYLSALGVLLGTSKALGRPVPRLSREDMVTMAVAAHKLSRVMAKDPITSPLRMPFTRFAGVSGPSELHEEVRASGKEHSVGELISCPFCMAPWMASGLLGGHMFAPNATRAVTTIYTVVAGSDFLQHAYTAAMQRSVPPEQR